MLGNSLSVYIFIRLCIILFHYAPFIWPALLLLGLTSTWPSQLTQLAALLTVLELTFAALVYLPCIARLRGPAVHPPPLSREQRLTLFRRCIDRDVVPDPEAYVKGWFLGADPGAIGRENVKEFLAWAYFEQDGVAALGREEREDLEGFVGAIEEMLGRRFPEGRGGAEAIRLTLDEVETRYRSVLWYLIVGIADLLTHLYLTAHGFRYYAQPRGEALSVFPPRIQQLTASRRSPAPEIGYWYRPHAALERRPIVFFHGIGIGLLAYMRFMVEIAKTGGGVGVLAVEMLPISFRLCGPPLTKPAFLHAMTTILDHHGLSEFALASHSYGSVFNTHLLLHSPALSPRIRSLVLIDPVTILLHRPDVAFNFTRRRPRRANEWQLWFFASMDPGVASCLGRWFFWRDNVLWREDLDAFHERGGKVCVYLAGRDLIVDTASVWRYLDGQRAEVVMFPDLDHAQVFFSNEDRRRIVDSILSYCVGE